MTQLETVDWLVQVDFVFISARPRLVKLQASHNAKYSIVKPHSQVRTFSLEKFNGVFCNGKYCSDEIKRNNSSNPISVIFCDKN